jgi:hypothetical protein
MKNLLNCHCTGLHSFPIDVTEDGLYRRIFYADFNHELWKPVELAIHPHHVDIKITVLQGSLLNPIYNFDNQGDYFFKFIWKSHILNGKGGFERIGQERLKKVSNIRYLEGQTVTMKACELHTVQVGRGEKCAWLIEESKPSCEYFPINYSKKHLQYWKPDGLYIECDQSTANNYINKYRHLIL